MPGVNVTTTTVARDPSSEDDIFDALGSILEDVVEPVERGVEQAGERLERGAQGFRAGVAGESIRQDVSRQVAGVPTRDLIMTAAVAGGVLAVAKLTGVV